MFVLFKQIKQNEDDNVKEMLDKRFPHFIQKLLFEIERKNCNEENIKLILLYNTTLCKYFNSNSVCNYRFTIFDGRTLFTLGNCVVKEYIEHYQIYNYLELNNILVNNIKVNT